MRLIESSDDRLDCIQNNLLVGVIGGLIAGLMLLLLEFLIRRSEKRQEKSERDVITFKNERRTITGSVFDYLAPGSSIEMMKEELGPPNKKWVSKPELFIPTDAGEEFYSKQPEFHTYLYIFKNAHLKVFSEDREMIDTLTVIALNNDISFENIPFHANCQDSRLNVAIVPKELFENEVYAEHFPGCRDLVTAIRVFVGNPFWTYITYFVNSETDAYELDLQEHPELLVGSTITGICLTKEAEHATYIYLSELLT